MIENIWVNPIRRLRINLECKPFSFVPRVCDKINPIAQQVTRLAGLSWNVERVNYTPVTLFFLGYTSTRWCLQHAFKREATPNLVLYKHQVELLLDARNNQPQPHTWLSTALSLRACNCGTILQNVSLRAPSNYEFAWWVINQLTTTHLAPLIFWWRTYCVNTAEEMQCSDGNNLFT